MTNPTLELILEDDTLDKLDDAGVADQVEDAAVDVTGGPVTAFPEDDPVVNVTQGKGYEKISDAVDDEEADAGDTIVVEDGTYYGSVEINVEGLTLEAADGDEPTINANGDDNAISVSVVDPDDDEAGVTISGFEITGFNERAVIAGFETGQPFESEVPVHLSDNVVKFDENDGDIPRGAFTVSVDGSTVINNDVDGGDLSSPDWKGFGIVVDGAENVTVSENTVDGHPDNIAIGISTWDGNASNIDIKNNTINEAGTALYAEETDGTIEEDTIAISGNDVDLEEIDGSTFVSVDELYDESQLDNILSSNEFDPDAVISNNQIVPDAAEGEVLNVNTGERFDGPSALANALDAADDNQRLRVGAGTYEESVTVNEKGLTLEGPNAGNAGYSENRDDEANIDGGVVIDGCNEVTVDGFKFTGVFDEDSVTSFGDSVALRNTEETSITNSIFDGSGIGAEEEKTPRAIAAGADNVRETTVSGVDIDDYFIGLQVRGTMAIEDSIIANVEEGGINADLADEVDGTPGLRVTNVDIETNSDYGVRFGEDTGSSVEQEEGLLIDSSTLDIKSGTAVVIRGSAFGDLEVTESNLLAETGVDSQTDTEVNATNNWWGTDIESDIEDLVSKGVDYSEYAEGLFDDAGADN